jgi:hypothetical protein
MLSPELLCELGFTIFFINGHQAEQFAGQQVHANCCFIDGEQNVLNLAQAIRSSDWQRLSTEKLGSDGVALMWYDVKVINVCLGVFVAYNARCQFPSIF